MSKTIRLGDSTLNWSGDDLLKLTRKDVRRELHESVAEMAEDVKRAAPEDTGELKKGIRITKDKGRGLSNPYAAVVSDRAIRVGDGGKHVSLAAMLEYGTVKMVRQPFMWVAHGRMVPKFLKRIEGLMK